MLTGIECAYCSKWVKPSNAFLDSVEKGEPYRIELGEHKKCERQEKRYMKLYEKDVEEKSCLTTLSLKIKSMFYYRK